MIIASFIQAAITLTFNDNCQFYECNNNIDFIYDNWQFYECNNNIDFIYDNCQFYEATIT